MTSNALRYFATPGAMTTPGLYSQTLDPLPSDLPSLCRLVQGLLVHIFWAERYGLQLSPERHEEVQLRSVERMLARIFELDPRPLTKERPLPQRLVGNCRSFSTLLAAILRHQGVPARARCGFGRYFLPGCYEDHWVCECWNAEQVRWVLVDAQLDPFQCDVLDVDFDPLDVPRDQFIVGGRAWQMCRSGEANADDFGIFDMRGFWFVRGNVVRDAAALNKMELLPWDSWGVADRPDDELSDRDLALLDRVAALTCGDVPCFGELLALYETDNRLRVPATIRSYLSSGVQTVDLAALEAQSA